MILQLENWHLGYSQILKDCREDEGSAAWILCNADVDAMAAARILCYMLRSDGIAYKLRPCTTYSALESFLGKGGDRMDTVRAVILLNLGASRNLTKLLRADNAAKIYVMDCRRPFHLANVHAGQNVVLFWDQNQLEIPSDGDNLSGNESTTSEEDTSSESESEQEDSDEGEQEFRDEEDDVMVDEIPPPKKPRLEQSRDYDGEDEDDDSEVEDFEDQDDDLATETRARSSRGDASPSTKQRKQSHDEGSSVTSKEGGVAGSEGLEMALSPQELHRQRRERLRLYYSGGSFYGVPASYVAYLLSTQLRFGELGDLLWLSCVGVTDAHVHSRLDMFGYARLAMELKTHCVRIYPNDMYHRAQDALYAEQLTGENQRETNPTQISLSENGRILAEGDFRFFLLCHSSLYESMLYSNYVSTKLQLWSSRGMLRFQELLAKMGCPLEECRQPFPFMKPSLRRTLREKFEMYAEEYGLENIEFTSFKRVTGYKSYLSASDMSYAVTALLECDTPATKSTTNNQEDDHEFLKAFNIAFDALNCNKSPNVILSEGNAVANLVNGGDMSGDTGIGAGICLAMSLQKNIITTAVSLVDRKAITPLRHFRYASISCTSQGSLGPFADEEADEQQQEQDLTNVFAKPLALTKLAHYLMDMHRENGKWTENKSRPLVLMAEKPRTKTYLVVGYEYPEHAGTAVKNRFGQNFELAAKTMKGTFRFDSFDSNVVEVDGNDVERFIEQLHYMMESM